MVSFIKVILPVWPEPSPNTAASSDGEPATCFTPLSDYARGVTEPK